ncbi:unnamed protein product [Paramecium sonneborni]|uniref:Transmembrane protein n=1 Tax=Paramecium sonneborni TaxID=65129 RepID=A0A8S1QZF3_9CILI|nr:unnamed protein product [Paramecium sonneborni]
MVSIILQLTIIINQKIDYLIISSDFNKFIQKNQKYSETFNDIIKQGKEKIDSTTKKGLVAEQFNQISLFIRLYNYYEKMKRIQEIQEFFYQFGSLFNGDFQIISLIYLTEFQYVYNCFNCNKRISNFIDFIICFFQVQNIKKFFNQKQVINVNLLKILDLVIFVFYLIKKQFTDKDFSPNEHQKFKSQLYLKEVLPFQSFNGILLMQAFLYNQ